MDEKEPVDLATFLKAFTTLLELYLSAHADNQAIQRVLESREPFQRDKFEAIAQSLRAEMLAQVQQALPASGDQLLELLRRFEGPVQ
jgi:hypothetical protein